MRVLSSNNRSAALITVFILVAACSTDVYKNPGYLEGVISIGPICPVVTNPPLPGCLPTAETYKAYPVAVYTPGRRTKVLQLSPALDGSFTAELPAGDYLLILDKPQNGPAGSNLPMEISITPHNTTVVNISIDTGIR